jgi:N-acetylmuramoyl-L-alanine amidase
VVLTRDGDRTMTLRQRMVEANVRAADIFVSVHANASPTRTQRGFETYVLSGIGVDVDARALRAESGTPRPGLERATALILDDIERGAAEWEAAELAVAIQDDLAAVREDSEDRGVRQDSQHVLLGATMPAVLVEVGFVDHPIEGRELADPAVQTRIATAIAEAIAAQLDL